MVRSIIVRKKKYYYAGTDKDVNNLIKKAKNKRKRNKKCKYYLKKGKGSWSLYLRSCFSSR